MMMRRISRIAMLMAVLTAMGGAQAAQAEAPSMIDSDGASATVRVLNNYRSAVRIFVEDSAGNSYLLGRVPRLGLETFEIPEGLQGSDVEIKVYPVNEINGYMTSDGANRSVKTGAITLVPGQTIDVWLEHDLSSSTVTVAEF